MTDRHDRAIRPSRLLLPARHRLRGRATVERVGGHGAPAAEGPARDRGQVPIDAPVRPAQPRTVLVVDDDGSIGDLIRRIAERDGWHALVVTTPGDALTVSGHLRVDLLVTDLDMPGMSGLDLAAQLWRRDADLPVLVVSGWPEASGFVAGPRLAFMSKPVEPDHLRAHIAALAGVQVAVAAGPRSPHEVGVIGPGGPGRRDAP
jgi:CheY-like chemotaxis protein